ncbi:hypothetical protein SOVF_087950 [Spinacia oleracea]|nr:hypothetical protein SOVF_087950 [Spinacia oleracea]
MQLEKMIKFIIIIKTIQQQHHIWTILFKCSSPLKTLR